MRGPSILRTSLLAVAAWLAPVAVCLAETAHDAHGKVGLKEDLPFWGLVAFVGFLIALKFLGWDALTSGMREREATEKKLIADAELLRDDTGALLRKNRGMMEALDELVRSTLAEAERDASHTRRDIRAIADREASLTRQRAESEINRARDQSLSDLFSATAARIAAEAERRIRSQLTPDQQQRLMDSAVGEFAKRK
jgi:F0F1-type ATP synthase membrane subunit b/b'